MKFTALSQKRSAVAALAIASVSFVVTLTVFASEPSDSGWTIARPKTVLDAKHTDSPEVRIAINQLLEQSRTPLLSAPAQPPAVKATQPAFAPPAIELPAADEAKERADAEDAKDSHATDTAAAPTAETVESPDDGPRIVFGDYSASADGWRPAHLPEDLPREPAGETKEATTDITPVVPRFRPVSSRPSSEAAAPEVDGPVEAAAPAQTEVDSDPRAAADSAPEESSAKSTINAKTFATSTDTGAEREDESAETEKKPVANRALVDVPSGPLPPLSQNMKNLRAKVRRVIKSYYTRPLNSRDNDPWELMHGMLAYGVHSKIRQGGPRGETITLVGWLCYNKPSKGFSLLYLTPENELRAKQGVGLQGHMGQFLAMLAQCQVSPDYPIRVRGTEFSINDLIEAEKQTCYPRSELTFKLIALMHYLDSDASWVNDQGQSWDIPRLIREEMAQPIRGAACGGTHRLSGLSLAARTRVRRGEPLDGEYLRAAQFVEKYQNYAFQLQNRDGSLSTEWFRGRGDEDDIDRRVKTTGHILEWLCYSLPEKDVRGGRTFSAVNYLSSLLASNFNHDWEVGPLGHAIHALRLYDERVFQPYDNQENVAKKPVQKTARRPAPAAQPRSHTMGF